jgi:hypothetical protein
LLRPRFISLIPLWRDSEASPEDLSAACAFKRISQAALPAPQQQQAA